MANVRWKDKNDIVTLAADDWIPVTDNSDSDADKSCTPAEIATYVFAAGGTLGTKLTAGAVEIEGSAFDINGGTIDGAVINSGSIGSTTAITKLNVDNIQIDGNTISSTDSNGNINLTPNGTGEVVIGTSNLNYSGTAVLATGTEINYLDGCVAGIMDITKGEGITKQSLSPAASASTVLTGGGHYTISTAAGASTLVLPELADGYCTTITVYLSTDNGDLTIIDNASDAGFTVVAGTHAGTAITLDSAGDYVMLKSPGVATARWAIVGGYSFTVA